VILGAGTFTQSSGAIVPDWDGHSLSGVAGSVGTVIEGQGASQTTFVKDNTDNTYTFYFADGNEGRVIFKNMKIYDTHTSSYMFNLQADSDVEVWDAVLGDGIEENSALAIVKNSLKVRRTELHGGPSSQNILATNANGSTIEVKNSAFIKGYRHVYINHTGTSVTLLNNSHYLFSSGGCLITASADTVPTIKNSCFYGAEDSSPITDLAGLTETDSEIDYNSYLRTFGNLAHDGGSHSLTSTDPLFINAGGTSASDYHLAANSPCINAGDAASAPADDFDGNSRPAG